MKMNMSTTLSFLVIIAAAVFAVVTILNFTGSLGLNPNQVLGRSSQIQPVGSSVGLEIGDKAPDFSVTTSDGQILRLRDFTSQKKPVILYFWATWCPFCRAEMKTLDSIYPMYKDRVSLVAIDLDTGETLEQIRDYKLQNHHDWIFTNGNVDILKNYNIRSTTTKYVIDSNGFIVTKGVGIISEDKWHQAFKMALGEI